MYYLLLLLVLVQPPTGKKVATSSPSTELPSISPTSAAKSLEYINFLSMWYRHGLKDANRINQRDYDEAFRTIASVHTQLSITWEGTANIVKVKAKEGFPAEEMVHIQFVVHAFLEKDGKAVPIHIPHNAWTKKIRPNTKVIVKAFIEDIRVHDRDFQIILSHVELVDRRP